MEPVAKTQNIRLADVFLIGPAMILGGQKLRASGDGLLGGALVLFGVLTILYNGKNYVRQLGEGA